MTKKNSNFASIVAPTLVATKPAPTAVVAPMTVGNMTQDDLVALIVRTIQATQALNVTPAAAPVAPAKAPKTRKTPANVPATPVASKPAPTDGPSKSSTYIARCGNVDPKVIKGHLANAYRAGQAAQAGRRNAEGTAAYKAGYNASLIAVGLPAFYA